MKSRRTALGMAENKSLLEKAAQALKALAARVREFLAKLTRNEAAQAFQGDAQALERMAELFNEAAQAARNSETEKNTRSGVRFAKNSVLEKYDIDERLIWDSVHVQKKVIKKLIETGFFDRSEVYPNGDIHLFRIDENQKSGMLVETNRGGIGETLNLNNYSRKSKKLKIRKLEAISLIPEVIREGEIIADNVENTHLNQAKANNKHFAYIQKNVLINGENVTMKIAVKKSDIKNQFWVHYIYINDDTGKTFRKGNNSFDPTATFSSVIEDSITQQAENSNGQNEQNQDVYVDENDRSDVHYALDDVIHDDDDLWADYDLDDKSTVDKFIEENPTEAVYAVIGNFAKSLGRAYRSFRGAQISEEAYLKTAKKIMSDYEISGRVHPNYAENMVSNVLKPLVTRLSGKGSLEMVLYDLIEQCRELILDSGSFDRSYMQAERELKTGGDGTCHLRLNYFNRLIISLLYARNTSVRLKSSRRGFGSRIVISSVIVPGLPPSR